MLVITNDLNNKKVLSMTQEKAIKYCQSQISHITGGYRESGIKFGFGEFGEINSITFSFNYDNDTYYMYIDKSYDYEVLD